jgi:hypothetical protein
VNAWVTKEISFVVGFLQIIMQQLSPFPFCQTILMENQHHGIRKSLSSGIWNPVSQRSSFSLLNFGTCAIKHVTYLKLRRRKMLLQAEQMNKMNFISLKMIKVVILSENSCHFVSCSACNNSLRYRKVLSRSTSQLVTPHVPKWI